MAIPYTLEETASWLQLSATQGTTPGSFVAIVDSSGLSVGVHEATITGSSPGRASVELDVTLTVTAAPGELVVVPQTLSFALNIGETDNAPFTVSTSGGGAVSFALSDDADWLGVTPPTGTTPENCTATVDTTGLAAGSYSGTITASSPGLADRTIVVSLNVAAVTPVLAFNPPNVTSQLAAGQTSVETIALVTSTGAPVAFTASSSAPWVTLSAVSGTTPFSLDVQIDSTGLADGVYQATVDAIAPGADPAALIVDLVVGTPSPCAPLPCEEILVGLPYFLEFRADAGGIDDAASIGTGFTAIDPPDGASAYRPELLHLDTANGVLELTTTRGIHYRDVNNQDDTLGVGLDLGPDPVVVATRLIEPNVGTGRFEQAGLWFGNDEDNFVKFVVASTRSGSKLHALLEVGGVPVSQTSEPPVDFTGKDADLELIIDPANQEVVCCATVSGGVREEIARFSPPPEFFGQGTAFIDPAIGTASYAGIFGTHRYGPSPVVWRFEGFSASPVGSTGGPTLALSESTVEFTLPPGQTSSQSVDITEVGGGAVAFTFSEFSPWLAVLPPSGTTPDSVNVIVDSSGLADGNYVATATAISSGIPPVELRVELSVVAHARCDERHRAGTDPSIRRCERSRRRDLPGRRRRECSRTTARRSSRGTRRRDAPGTL